MSLAILGLATALPTHAISQDRASAVAQAICRATDDRAAILSSLYRQSGIQQRHLVVGADVAEDVLNGTRLSGSIFLPSGGEQDLGPSTGLRMEYYAAQAAPLAINAARAALHNARVAAANLTHLVTVSCTGFSAPGVDCDLIEQLGMSPSVLRTHVGFMGCHGAINGLRVAQAFADGVPNARILLCAVELCSIHFHYEWDPKKLVANVLFADGAAAVVGAPAAETQAITPRVCATGSNLFPNTASAMTWKIGDHGFTMTLSTRIPGLINSNLRSWLEHWLKQNRLAIADVGAWAVHPGGPRILNVVEECLGLPQNALDVSREVLAECGNMSSPTVLFVVERLCQLRAPRPYVVLAFGPGLVVEAALIA